MKLLIVGDVHWSTYSSIVRKRGKDFSVRLENLIKSINWAEEQSINFNCDEVVYLGDFFDKPELNAEELTALDKINWSNLKHNFIVGNHESNIASLEYNSTKALNKINFNIIDKLNIENTPSINIIYIPYTLEENRVSIKEITKNITGKKLIFSHNDLKMNYGNFISKEGFDLKDIEDNCDLFINGHLHNGTYVTKKILNLGNLTGQNFTENAYDYAHRIAILDTDTLNIDFIENPYAFNFYKLEINNEKDLEKLHKLKNNSVLSIKCEESLIDKCKQEINNVSSIVEYKLIAFKNLNTENKIDAIKLNNVDHLKQFNDFILANIGSFDIVKEELAHICGEVK